MLILTMRNYTKFKKKGIKEEVNVARLTTKSGEEIFVVLSDIKGQQARVGFSCDRDIKIDQLKLKDCNSLKIGDKDENHV